VLIKSINKERGLFRRCLFSNCVCVSVCTHTHTHTHSRGGQLDQIWGPHFRWQQTARAAPSSQYHASRSDCQFLLFTAYALMCRYLLLISTLHNICTNLFHSFCKWFLSVSMSKNVSTNIIMEDVRQSVKKSLYLWGKATIKIMLYTIILANWIFCFKTWKLVKVSCASRFIVTPAI
jgi:hypothetical protein